MTYSIYSSGQGDELTQSIGPFRIFLSDNSFYGSQESESLEIGTTQIFGEDEIINLDI
jgi:hypothetical protein